MERKRETMDRELGIAIGSTCSKPGDAAGNLAQIGEFCRRAQANGCDLLLTPELSASGYGGYPETLATAEEAGRGPIYKALAAMAAKYGLTVTAGFAEKAGERRHIAHYIVSPDGAYVVQRKHRVTPSEAPFDPAGPLWFDGREDIGQLEADRAQLNCFSCRGAKCALIVCADAGLLGLNETLSRQGVEVMLLAVGAGGSREDRITNAELSRPGGLERLFELGNNPYFYPADLIRDSIMYRRASAVVNMGGFDGKRMYHGGSGSVVSPCGIIEAHLAGIENIDEMKPMFACGRVNLSRVITMTGNGEK